MPRRVSSSSSRSESWPVRNSTACARSSIPSSRAASTRSHTSPRLLAFVAREHELRAPAARRGRSTAACGKPQRSCAETALATARIGVRGAVVALERHRVASPGTAAGSRGCGGRSPRESRRSPGSRRRPRVRPAPPRRSAAHDVDLQAVDVLVLVDEHVVEAAGDARPDALVAGQRPPVRAAGRRDRAGRARACAPRRRGTSRRAPRGAPHTTGTTRPAPRAAAAAR